ncbi:MAG: hypothetical protein FJ044_05180, partial [Candidatus Cloacimonetes bacterium]|nr:hypothetical protein [Candidatus Cloacimonadota bacterium]
EVNISIQQSTINNQQLPPYKVEVKNINSFRFLKQATEYEIRRQTEFLEKGKAPIQETRGFDETKSITFTQRFKEETQDYRYFPEPDLPPLRFTDEEIETLKSKIPKLPQILIQEIISELGISENQAKILAKNRKAFISAKALITGGIEPQKAANLIINRPEVLAMKPEELLEKIKIEEESRVGDRDELSVIIQKVIRDNPNPIRDYQSGKKEALKFLIGQVMRVTSGRADPQVTKETLENLLQQSKPTLDK